MYEDALEHEDVLGLVIATRPDSIQDEVLDYLEDLANTGVFIKLEFGLESTNNNTLKTINRCQTYQEAIDAFNRAKLYDKNWKKYNSLSKKEKRDHRVKGS